MNIYMDVCCLNRPFDQTPQRRVELEADAILTILERCQQGDWTLAASSVIEQELLRIQDSEKLGNILTLYSCAKKRVYINEWVKTKASDFIKLGMTPLDSYHLALASVHELDVFLSTDDKLLRKATAAKPGIHVANPVSWVMEVMKNGQ